MTDRPILFSPPMVRALLEGRKTQTRRALKPGTQPAVILDGNGILLDPSFSPPATCIGDHLWVREEYYQRGHWIEQPERQRKSGRMASQFIPESDEISFEPPAEFRKGRRSADPHTVAWHWRLGRFMPRRYSRMTLTVTDVRVERLQDISEADAVAEGIDRDWSGKFWRHYEWHDDFAVFPETSYMTLWDSINTEPGKRWADNPWVVALTFTVEQRNIDAGDRS